MLAAAVLILALPRPALAYIGPGAGFALAGSAFAVLAAVFSAVVMLFTWPVRWAVRWVRGGLALARSRVKRFVILGLDGMDYRLTQQFLAEGKLPNLAALRDQGCFKPLLSTVPPISPVAWSSFQTGVNPGKHNIFDFLTPDLRTYQPKLSSTDIRPPRRFLGLGKYRIPLGGARIRLLRKSTPFWTVLGKHGIFASVLRVPITFPPEKLRGVLLSGMCVPDLRGSQGMFSYYTTRGDAKGENTGGETRSVVRQGDAIHAALIGPENPLRKDGAPLELPFAIKIRGADSAELTIGGTLYRLRTGDYSEWIRVAFRAGPGIKVYGICRFLLKSTEPDFALYVTPINLDPERPAMPISYPAIYATYLAKRQGRFATLGLAEDSWALNEGVLDDKDFIRQCVDFDREREQMFFDCLDKVKRGLCACVFDGTDRIQHAFWRDTDAGDSPIPSPSARGQGEGAAPSPDQPSAAARRGQDEGAAQTPNRVLEELYLRMDALVGRVVAACDHDRTVLMIISDHGFNSFRRGVDLNRWLETAGYLAVKEGRRPDKYLAAVDWSRTRAFAVGLAGIFINLKGRQSQGIVAPGAEAAALRREIAQRLGGLADPESGQPAVKTVYLAQEVYRGPYKDAAPDLIVGYQRGYRASWETAVGQVTDDVFHTNKKAWSGDHCVDQSLVPGVLFCNRKIADERPRLMDVGPTVLEMFGVPLPGYMDGVAWEVEERS
jgi:predicted AlkP superfamily phosphohydrolase/phosphomutase